MTAENPPPGRECILEEAQRLFALHGYHGVSVRDIVHACGLSNAALYYHFGSKKSLFFAALQALMADALARLSAADPGTGRSRERLSTLAHAYSAIILESQSTIQTLFRDLASFDRDEIRRMLPDAGTQLPQIVARVLDDGVSSGEVRPIDTFRTASLLLDLIGTVAARRLHDMHFAPLEDTIDLVIDIFFHGVGTRPAPPTSTAADDTAFDLQGGHTSW